MTKVHGIKVNWFWIKKIGTTILQIFWTWESFRKWRLEEKEMRACWTRKARVSKCSVSVRVRPQLSLMCDSRKTVTLRRSLYVSTMAGSSNGLYLEPNSLSQSESRAGFVLESIRVRLSCDIGPWNSMIGNRGSERRMMAKLKSRLGGILSELKSTELSQQAYNRITCVTIRGRP